MKDSHSHFDLIMAPFPTPTRNPQDQRLCALEVEVLRRALEAEREACKDKGLLGEECRALRESIAPVGPALRDMAAAMQGLTDAVNRRDGTGGGEEASQRAVPSPTPAPVPLPVPQGDGGFGRAAEAVRKCADQIGGFFEEATHKTLTEEPGTVWTNATYAVETVQRNAMGALAVTEEAMRRKAQGGRRREGEEGEGVVEKAG
jgi:hypothetical protein